MADTNIRGTPPSTRFFNSAIEVIVKHPKYLGMPRKNQLVFKERINALEIDDDVIKSFIRENFGIKEYPKIIKKISELIAKKSKDEEEVAREREQSKFKSFVFNVDNFGENVERFYGLQPFFYDKKDLFWIWNFEDKCWDMIDETDMMNKLEKVLHFNYDTIGHTRKGNYLEAMRRIGRSKHPKETPKKWIQFKDKAFSLKSKKVYDVTPDFFFCNPIPHSIGKSDATPIMDKLFKEWVGEDYVQSLYEILAYCCISDYPIHIIFVFIGGGSNGKSSMQSLINRFIGKSNVTSTELDSLIENRFESTKLYKKLVVLMGETNFGVLNKTSLIKKLCGGDLIGYEFKNKQPFDDYNYAKIIISTNSLPTTNDESDGFYRRFFIIDFPNQFTKNQDILGTIPDEEFSNLANKLCKILPSLLDSGEFSNSGDMVHKRKKYIESSNPLSIFLKDYYEIEEKSFIKSNDVFNEYKKYLIKNKRRVVKLSEFRQALENEGFFANKTKKKIGSEMVNGFEKFIYQDTYWVDGLKMKDSQFSRNSLCICTLSPYKENRVDNSGNLEKTERETIIIEEASSNKLPFDKKCIVWQPCCWKIENCVCGEVPSNMYENKSFCEKHFFEAQKNHI